MALDYYNNALNDQCCQLLNVKYLSLLKKASDFIRHEMMKKIWP